MTNDNKYSVLFTGGIDSTYRLCQLAQDATAVVQPVYILFPNRPELEREIEAQDKILSYIHANPKTKARVLPIQRIPRDDIPKDQRIMDLEQPLGEIGFGWQYLYIALYAKWNPGVELCHETLPENFFTEKGLRFKETDGRRYIEPDGLDDTLRLAFENVTFPIMHITRQQMVDDLKIWGYEGVWKYIWFCYEAIDGKPCGICDNCRIKLQEGLEFLFSKEAIHRYYCYLYLEKYHPDYSLETYCLWKYKGSKAVLFDSGVVFDNLLYKRLLIRLDNYIRLEKNSVNQLKKLIEIGSDKYGLSTNMAEKLKLHRKRG